MASLVYAPAGSGPSAGGIGWLNFGAIVINPGNPAIHVQAPLNDGTMVEFDLTAVNVSGTVAGFQALTVPTWNGTFFSNPGKPVNGYALAGNPNDVSLKIPGNPALVSNFFGLGKNTLQLRNIILTDINGNQVNKYKVIVADAESTDFLEVMEWVTDGGIWQAFALLGNTIPPISSGIGTSQTVTLKGTPNSTPNVIHENYVLTTDNPTSLDISAQATGASVRVGFSIAFIVTKVEVQKEINGRLDPADQFTLDITGDNIASTTTTGNINGLQNEVTTAFGVPGELFIVNEIMGAGSVNPLSAYSQTVSAVNISTGLTVPPVGPLPISLNPMLGDIIIYTIKNSILAPVVEKKVDRANAGFGDIITYTVTINNPNSGVLSGVGILDAIPVGTTFIAGSVIATNTTIIGNDPSVGLTLNGIPANGQATVVWKVQIESTLPNPNPIVNVAAVTDPTGQVLETNKVETKVNYADLLAPGNFVKSVDKTGVGTDAVIIYTLTITNTGNIAADNISIKDIIPAGTTYIAGSTSADVAFSGDPTSTINLTNSLGAGATAIVTFKVKSPATIPNPNLLENQANIKYNYTPDPENPVIIEAAGDSNTVTTEVNIAKLSIKKEVLKTIAYVGDIIKYNIVVTNTGNINAENVVINDVLPAGVSYVAGSINVSVAFSGDPITGIVITNPIAPAEFISISFEVKVKDIPNPNPISNVANAEFVYFPDLTQENPIIGSSKSNLVSTFVPRYNFGQQISDIIQSIALEEAALAAIVQAEGAKIQAIIKMENVTTSQLLCLNKSVERTLEAITLLESILKQKLNSLMCQIDASNRC